MKAYLNSPLFGVTITILTFLIGSYINKKTKLAILNPILLSAFAIIFCFESF